METEKEPAKRLYYRHKCFLETINFSYQYKPISFFEENIFAIYTKGPQVSGRLFADYQSRRVKMNFNKEVLNKESKHGSLWNLIGQNARVKNIYLKGKDPKYLIYEMVYKILQYCISNNIDYKYLNFTIITEPETFHDFKYKLQEDHYLPFNEVDAFFTEYEPIYIYGIKIKMLYDYAFPKNNILFYSPKDFKMTYAQKSEIDNYGYSTVTSYSSGIELDINNILRKPFYDSTLIGLIELEDKDGL